LPRSRGRAKAASRATAPSFADHRRLLNSLTLRMIPKSLQLFGIMLASSFQPAVTIGAPRAPERDNLSQIEEGIILCKCY